MRLFWHYFALTNPEGIDLDFICPPLLREHFGFANGQQIDRLEFFERNLGFFM